MDKRAVNRKIRRRALLARLRAYCFPGGEEAARQVRTIKTTQRGEIRASASARWTPFTADEVIEAGRSSFRWEARIGAGMISPVVTIRRWSGPL